MIKLSFKIIIFLLIFIGITKSYFDYVFKKPNSFEQSIDELYSKRNDTPDVFILGSSHARNSFNPAIIDKALKINCYSLASGGQKLIVTNNLLEDILKEYKPKLIILDVFPGSMDFPKLSHQKSNQLQVFDNSKWSLNKFKLATSIYSTDELPSVLSPTIRNHRNWSISNWSLKNAEFKNTDAFFYKGFSGSYSILEDEQRIKLLDYKSKMEQYLKANDRKTDSSKFSNEISLLKQAIKISKNNNVELLVVSAPYFDAFYNPQGSNFNYLVQQICDNEKIRFLDFNSEFEGLGLNMNDFRDRSHVNLSGSDKVTNFLIKYLLDKEYFQLSKKDINNLNETLKSLSNQFELVFEESTSSEIFPNVFTNHISISKNKEVYQIVLTLNKNENVKEVLKKYNLEYIASPFEIEKEKLPREFKNLNREIYTFYNIKIISIEGQNRIIFRVPKSDITKYKNIRIYSFEKGKKQTSKKFVVDFQNTNLGVTIESKNEAYFLNSIANNNFKIDIGKAEKIVSEPFRFNESIIIDEISYLKQNEQEYTFFFKMKNENNQKDIENFRGYIRYYIGEINENNKYVNSFPINLVEIGKNKYIFARITIEDVELTKLDFFFINKKTKQASKFFTTKNLKLIK